MIYVTTPQTLKSSPSVISISGYSGLAGTSQRLPSFLQTRFKVYSPFSSQTAICFSVGFRSLLSTMMMSPSFTPASTPRCPAPVRRCSAEWGNRPPPSHQKIRYTLFRKNHLPAMQTISVIKTNVESHLSF